MHITTSMELEKSGSMINFGSQDFSRTLLDSAKQFESVIGEFLRTNYYPSL